RQDRRVPVVSPIHGRAVGDADVGDGAETGDAVTLDEHRAAVDGRRPASVEQMRRGEQREARGRFRHRGRHDGNRMQTLPKCLPSGNALSAGPTSAKPKTWSSIGGRTWCTSIARTMSWKSSRLPTVTPCSLMFCVTTGPRFTLPATPLRTPISETVPL